MNGRRNLFILIGVLIAVAIVGVVAARPHGRPVVVRTATAAYGHYETQLPESGVVQRPLTRTLAALVPGNLGEIYAHPGQHVARGQLLATIANAQLVDAETMPISRRVGARSRPKRPTARCRRKTNPRWCRPKRRSKRHASL